LISRGGGADPAPSGWWLSGGISPSIVRGAYQAKGAASQADSEKNLNNPGTDDLAVVDGTPQWNTNTGWAFSGDVGYECVKMNETDLILCQFDGEVGYFKELFCVADEDARMYGVVPDGWIVRDHYAVIWKSSYVGTGNLTTGNLGLHSDAMYLNGVLEVDISATPFPDIDVKMGIGGQNTVGGMGNQNTTNIIAVVVYSELPTADQILAVAQAMAAL
jgi:hypothetical protein